MYNVVRGEVLIALFAKVWLSLYVAMVVLAIICIIALLIKERLDKAGESKVMIIKEEGETSVPCSCTGCHEIRRACELAEDATITVTKVPKKKALKKKSKAKKSKKLG